MRECGTRSTELASCGILFIFRYFFFSRFHSAHELVTIVTEDQEILGVDLGDDGPVVELVGLRVARQVAVD
jgi:hypothetical protein